MWRHLTFGRKYFSTSMIFLETREEKKSKGLYKENRVDVLGYSHPVLSYLRPCELRRCHVTN